MATYSGNVFDLINPLAADVNVRDIAHHISQLCRYTGATKHPYSVAEHSVLVRQLMIEDELHPELCFAGLMHDAHEAYYGDVSSPLKKALGEAYKRLERRGQLAVMNAFAVSWDDAVEALVRKYDLIARRLEAHHLMAGSGESWGWGDVPLLEGRSIARLDSDAAKRLFVHAFRVHRPWHVVLT